MAQFTTTIPDAWAARMQGPINAYLESREATPVMQKILNHFNAGSVSELSNAEKAEAFTLFSFWLATSVYETEQAQSAVQAVAQASIDEFVL